MKGLFYMRRAALFLLLVLSLSFILSSCSLVGNSVNDVKEILSYPVCISAKTEQDTPFEFKIYIYENETLFTFTSPKILSPLTVQKSSEGYKAKYDGLETTIDRSGILAADALDTAIDTVKACEECVQKTENGEDVLLFSIDGNKVLVYYNKDSKQITKIISEAAEQLFTYKILSVEKINT
jgi:hypothetical protein